VLNNFLEKFMFFYVWTGSLHGAERLSPTEIF
jgi:hypothetical protein